MSPDKNSVVNPGTGEVVGVWRTFRGSRGPLIYGDVPYEHDGTLRKRILYAIASRESPLRSAGNPAKVHVPLSPSVNGVQIYEPWVSAGIVHFISKNGNLQRVLQQAMDESPEVRAFLSSSGVFLEEDTFLREGEDGLEPWALEEMRESVFPLVLNTALGMPGAKGPQEEQAWGLILERDAILRAHGWYAAVMADERLRLLTASLAINASVKLMRRCLLASRQKTAEALTQARISVYNEIGSGFGKARASWEARTDLVTDGEAVVL